MNTFNYLNYEGRYVAAALYPPDKMGMSETERLETIGLFKNLDDMNVDPLTLLGLSGYDPSQSTAIGQIWGSEEQRKKAADERALEEAKEEAIRDGLTQHQKNK